MSQLQTITGTVLSVERHGHTVYGNPMMSATIKLSHIDGTVVGGNDDSRTVTLRISNNASIVYAIENPEFRDELHTFKVTPAGRISGIGELEA